MVQPRRNTPVEPLGAHTRKIGTLQHFRWLRGIILTILLLNVIDAGLTLRWIQGGYATEANPMMEVLAHDYPLLFVIVKFVLVALGAYLLWRLRKRRLAIVSIFLAFLAYYCVLLYHLSAMQLNLFERLLG